MGGGKNRYENGYNRLAGDEGGERERRDENK